MKEQIAGCVGLEERKALNDLAVSASGSSIVERVGMADLSLLLARLNDSLPPKAQPLSSTQSCSAR